MKQKSNKTSSEHTEKPNKESSENSAPIISKPPQRIETQDQLDKLIKEAVKKSTHLECFISLNFGLRSSKKISFTPQGNYYVYHECDDTEEIVPYNSFLKTFTGKALLNGALYKYPS